jgi:excisionase family DNA binding protein
MSDEKKKWKSEPVYEFSAALFGGPDPQGEKVYTIKEAAEATGLPEKLIRQEIEAGAIPIVDLPGERRMRVRRQDLNGYIRVLVKRKVEDDEEE